jgi:hypothetical protein
VAESVGQALERGHRPVEVWSLSVLASVLLLWGRTFGVPA